MLTKYFLASVWNLQTGSLRQSPGLEDVVCHRGFVDLTLCGIELGADCS
jgi:hypothetical protein